MPTARRNLVFISSTSDLVEERRKVAEALPTGTFEGYLYEKDRPRGISPKEWLEKKIAESDVFVGIYGGRFGSVYPGQEASIVEWELETATAQEGMELMGFKKDGLLPESVEPEQAEFLDKIGDFVDGNWLGTFSGPEKLVEKVLSGLLDWQSELKQRIEEMEAERGGWRDKLLLPTAAASVLGLFALTQQRLVPLIDGPSLGVGALIAVCVTGATVALWRKGK